MSYQQLKYDEERTHPSHLPKQERSKCGFIDLVSTYTAPFLAFVLIGLSFGSMSAQAASDGTVISKQKISATAGNFGEVLDFYPPVEKTER